jgi:hypothetical protein
LAVTLQGIRTTWRVCGLHCNPLVQPRIGLLLSLVFADSGASVGFDVNG